MSSDFIRVASVADLDACFGTMKVVVNGKGVAIFRRDDQLYAVQNACPHRGAPLIGGQVHRLTDGLFVICPDHAWRFDLVSGVCPEAGPECSLLTWDVKIEDGEVFVSRLPRMT